MTEIETNYNDENWPTAAQVLANIATLKAQPPADNPGLLNEPVGYQVMTDATGNQTFVRHDDPRVR